MAMFRLSVATPVIHCFIDVYLSDQDFSAQDGLAAGVTHQNDIFYHYYQVVALYKMMGYAVG
ncbi:MAG: hypothetical protein HRT37_19485 [Alteromonadaceae bacterium]|nr:hypothetical protein [Alteromonadaceae bacterium]